MCNLKCILIVSSLFKNRMAFVTFTCLINMICEDKYNLKTMVVLFFSENICHIMLLFISFCAICTFLLVYLLHGCKLEFIRYSAGLCPQRRQICCLMLNQMMSFNPVLNQILFYSTIYVIFSDNIPINL